MSESDSVTNSKFESCPYSMGCAIIQAMSALVARSGSRSASRQNAPANWANRPMPKANFAKTGDMAPSEERHPCSLTCWTCSGKCVAVRKESSRKVATSISRTTNSRRGPQTRVSIFMLYRSSIGCTRRSKKPFDFFGSEIARGARCPPSKSFCAIRFCISTKSSFELVVLVSRLIDLLAMEVYSKWGTMKEI